MTAVLDVNPIDLSKVLKKLFPKVTFYPPVSDERQYKIPEKTDLYYFIQENNINYMEKDTLVFTMINSNKFSALFPKDPLQYRNELKAFLQNDDCQVIKFFINKTNEKFFEGFNAVVHEKAVMDNCAMPDVAQLFYKAVFNNKTYYYKDLSDPDILNICEHSPSSFYGAFEYYAHKQYTLIRLSREFFIGDLHEKWKSELSEKLNDRDKSNNYQGLNFYYNVNDDDNVFIDTYDNVYRELKQEGSDIDYAWNIINELFIQKHKGLQKLKEKNDSIKLQANFITGLTLKIMNILESTADEYDSRYTPAEFVILAGQISGQLGHKKFENKYCDQSSLNENINNDKDNDNMEMIKIEDAGIFADNFLIKEFNAVKDGDFIISMGKKGEWSIHEKNIGNSIYYQNTGNLIFDLYSGENKNVSQQIFLYKLKKTLKKYKKWKKETRKEGEIENDA
jgi:hypothetical protein